MRWLMMFVLFAMLARRYDATSAEDTRVKGLIRDWAPLVWLAPGERFLPLGVPEFLDNMQADDNYLITRLSLDTLLQNRSSFLHGRKPAGNVPIYALVKNCLAVGPATSLSTTVAPAMTTASSTLGSEKTTRDEPTRTANLLIDELALKPIETNNVPGSLEISDISLELPSQSLETSRRVSRSRPISRDMPSLDNLKSKPHEPDEQKRRKLKLRRLSQPQQPGPHFHVTYWMFYPFSEGKAVCVLDLGFLGSWPIPSWGGVCLGRLKEYGSHVGDWEHVSLYFKGKDHPLAMYVSAHDAGAFYRYETRSGTFVYESQETRKGIFQKPIFPERVYTSAGSHPVLFSARGSHGLWTAPGKHKFVRLPRLYDESGFGIPWPTWKKVELLSAHHYQLERSERTPGWMSFTGKWGNPKSNCHPLAKLGFNICEFVDGPTGIPTKKMNFRC